MLLMNPPSLHTVLLHQSEPLYSNLETTTLHATTVNTADMVVYAKTNYNDHKSSNQPLCSSIGSLTDTPAHMQFYLNSSAPLFRSVIEKLYGVLHRIRDVLYNKQGSETSLFAFLLPAMVFLFNPSLRWP